MAEQLSISVRVMFTRHTEEGDYSDCLVYPIAEFLNPDGTQKISQQRIDKDIEDRINPWLQRVKQAKADAMIRPEPTLDELFAEFDDERIEKFKIWLEQNGKADKIKGKA